MNLNKHKQYNIRLSNFRWNGTSRRKAKNMGNRRQGRVLVPLEQYFGKVY